MTTIKQILAEFDKLVMEDGEYKFRSRGTLHSFISSTHSHLIEEIIKMAEDMKTPKENLSLNQIITNLSTLNE